HRTSSESANARIRLSAPRNSSRETPFECPHIWKLRRRRSALRPVSALGRSRPLRRESRSRGLRFKLGRSQNLPRQSGTELITRIIGNEAPSQADHAISPSQVLAMLPRGLQFCFLDEIKEIDAAHVVATYRFREDEMFYPGHFPEKAVTPGTILLEAMCQCGI